MTQRVCTVATQLTELKPCKHCGWDAEHLHIYYGEEYVRCPNDDCKPRPGVWGAHPEQAALAWNALMEEDMEERQMTVNKYSHIIGTCEVQFRLKNGQEGFLKQWGLDHFREATIDLVLENLPKFFPDRMIYEMADEDGEWNITSYAEYSKALEEGRPTKAYLLTEIKR